MVARKRVNNKSLMGRQQERARRLSGGRSARRAPALARTRRLDRRHAGAGAAKGCDRGAAAGEGAAAGDGVLLPPLLRALASAAQRGSRAPPPLLLAPPAALARRLVPPQRCMELHCSCIATRLKERVWGRWLRRGRGAI